jgi:ribosomal protein L11 methyltransferase
VSIRWIELSVTLDSAGFTAAEVNRVVDFLGKYGQGGAAVERCKAEETGNRSTLIRIYLPHNRSYKTLRSEILQGLAEYELSDQVAERWLKPEDWLDSLKQHFGILEIGEKFVIKPSWAFQPLPATTRIVIQLDPGAAFGTGMHATTRMCLLRLEKHFSPGMSVLDVGTGSGILAIAAARLGAFDVLALDTDAVAVKVARSNAATNDVAEIVRVKRGTLSTRRVRENKDRFDIALANITARAICDLSRGFCKSLKPGGRLVVSGINSQSLDEVLISLALADFKLEAVDQYESWYAAVACKMQ